MNKKLVLGFLFSVIITVSFSQEKTDSLQIDLREIGVNAALYQLNPGSGRLLTVIDRKTIEKMPLQSIDDLLESLSGVDIRNRGVGGTQSDISIRGGSFDQVLVLLNGVNITDPQTGHYNLDIPIELSDIARIELLQGSAARIYGPNAFSGAINIVTNGRTNNSAAAQLTAGSFGTFTQNISGNLGNKKFATFASFSNKSSDGYISNTDYKILNAFSHTTLNTVSAGKFDLQLAYQQKSYGANAFYSFKYPNQFDHTQTFFGSLSWLLHLKNLEIQTQGYARRHYDRFELFREDYYKNKNGFYVRNASDTAKYSTSFSPASYYKSHNYHLTDVIGGKASAVILTNIGKFVAGIDVRNEHIYSTVLGTALTSNQKNTFEAAHPFTKESNRFISTAAVDYSKKIQNLNISAGIAVTNNEKFGTYTNGGIDLSYVMNENLNVFASANTAVRVPTFTDLYYKSATQIANPNLKPEKSTTVEVGMKYNKNRLSINGLVYYRMGNNIIDWVKLPTATVWESKNLTSVNALGADIQAEYKFENCFIKKMNASYSYLTLDKQADTFDSKYTLDYLRNKVVVGVSHDIVSKLSAQWKFSYNERAGNYTDFATNQLLSYKPFTMADVRLLWVDNYFDIFADVNNLLDVKYADYGGLAQPGINFNAGVRFRL
ncbi:MAG: TonB-dependent receptor [Paludibacter sp.]